MSSIRFGLLAAALVLVSGVAHAAEGMITIKSNHSVSDTADRLESVLQEKGMKIVARVNHGASARSVDLELRPTELVIFGNPKVGTPLMQCTQTVALDLPQKALIWEDEDGQVWLGYNDPAYLGQRHHIEGCDEVLAKVSGALKNFAGAATR